MSGTRIGGVKVAAALKKKDPDYYIKLGAMGGATPTPKPRGFSTMPPKRLAEVSAKGGRISRRVYA